MINMILSENGARIRLEIMQQKDTLTMQDLVYLLDQITVLLKGKYKKSEQLIREEMEYEIANPNLCE